MEEIEERIHNEIHACAEMAKKIALRETDQEKIAEDLERLEVHCASFSRDIEEVKDALERRAIRFWYDPFGRLF